MKLYSFGGLTLPTTLQQEVFPMAGRESLVTLRDGAFDEDGADPVLQPYRLERSFDVTDSAECAADLDATIDELLAVAGGGRHILKAILRDKNTYRQTFAKLVGVQRPRNLDMQVRQPMTVSFLVDYPYWMASADEPHYLDNGDKLDAGWTLDGNYTSQALSALSTTLTITPGGTARIRRGLIVFKPRAAGNSITNPKVYNAANGMWVQYTGVITNPDQLSLDLLPKSAKVNWVTDAYSGIGIGVGQMDWMLLETQANPIAVTCTAISGNVDMEWHWSRHYL